MVDTLKTSLYDLGMKLKRYGPYRGTKYGHLLYKDEYPDGRRVTVWVHREVLEKKLGRELRSNEVAHHIDGDPSNNDPDNLEARERRRHAREHRPEPEMIRVECVECGEWFYALARQIRHNQDRQGKAGPFCSRRCSGRHNARIRYQPP